MAAVRTAFGRSERGASGIGEEIQEVEGFSSFWSMGLEGSGNPVPHRAGFGEHAEMSAGWRVSVESIDTGSPVSTARGRAIRGRFAGEYPPVSQLGWSPDGLGTGWSRVTLPSTSLRPYAVEQCVVVHCVGL